MQKQPARKENMLKFDFRLVDNKETPTECMKNEVLENKMVEIYQGINPDLDKSQNTVSSELAN